MRSIQYKITAPGHDNHMTVTYNDGKLYAIEGIHLMAKFWENTCINAPIPIDEMEIPARERKYEGLIHFEEIELTATGKKIALFCSMYKAELGVKYKVQHIDARKISNLKIDEDLLRLYFTNTEWWGKQPKSIANLATNYNNLLQLQANGAPKKKENGFPDHWSQAYQDRLPTHQHTAYWKHLRSLGLHPVRDTSGKVIEWAKQSTTSFILILLVLCTLFVSGCMTPQRAARYMDKYPEYFPTEVDTFYKAVVFEFTDEIPVPGDTAEWEWVIAEVTADSAGQQTAIDTNLLAENDRLRAQLRLKTNSNKNLWLQLKTQVKDDTVYLEKQIEVPCPGTNTKTTITVKQHWWMPILIVILAVLLIISLLWRKR